MKFQKPYNIRISEKRGNCKMLRVVIAEDNRHERLALRKMLSCIPGLSIEGETDNGVELVNLVEAFSPHVVFIDIEMRGTDGFEAASAITEINPKTFLIFSATHESYAKQAFDVFAFDFLTRPYDFNRIVRTIERIKSLMGGYIRPDREISGRLQSGRLQDGWTKQKLVIQTEGSIIFINASEILMITKSERKTDIHTVYGVYKINEPLEKIETRLGNNFFRSHKGYIINTDMIMELTSWGSKTYLVKLRNTKETALMTVKSLKLFKQIYCID